MIILGVSAYYHDSAACLLKDGRIVCAAQEERFTRKKHDPRFPGNAIRFCLEEGGITTDSLDHVVFYDKPFLTFERLLESYLEYAPYGVGSFLQAMPAWIKQKLHLRKALAEELEGYKGDIKFCEHHESHAASAFYPSPFDEAAIITLDGVGEWTTTSLASGRGSEISFLKEIRFPHSLGLLYSAFTYYMGFKVNSGEYKVMGLAPYGEPKYVDIILNELIDLKEDGSFKLNMKYFNYCAGLTMTNSRFHGLFGGPPRKPETNITAKEMDLARSVQEVIELAVMRIAVFAKKLTGHKSLCMAGGVALNCVANGKILSKGIFDNVWIQPAAGDAGGALGAALAVWHRMLGEPRAVESGRDSQMGSYLGPAYSNDEIESFLKKIDAPYEKVSDGELPKKAADILASERVLGWFYGRMEYGPRALGGRSILGDARSVNMQSEMNLKIKFRESFRPFAPSVLRERVADYFEMETDSPYMLMVAPVLENKRRGMTEVDKKRAGFDRLNVVRSDVPAVTHVDYSARIQTVDGTHNGMYREMIAEFEKLTGCPMIINTSFNVRGEPIVNTPEEAYHCFMRTNMDYLVLGNLLLDKSRQPAFADDGSWKKEFELD
ncbi:MAG: carbamoyltransferase [Nitrospinota bacterium]